MIQQPHLTAWQAYAPWDRRSKIEQDLRLSRVVAVIFSDDILAEHLALRGGTVLHKGHLAPAARYSEDLAASRCAMTQIGGANHIHVLSDVDAVAALVRTVYLARLP